MECKLSEENSRLEKAVEEANKRVEWSRDEVRRSNELHRVWCDDLSNKLNGLGYNDSPNLDSSILKVLDELISLREKSGISTKDIKVGRCEGTHCKRYVSTDWDFCPWCGMAMGKKVKTSIEEIFKKIEEELVIPRNSEDTKYLRAWSCRWAWAKRRLIEGRD